MEKMPARSKRTSIKRATKEQRHEMAATAPPKRGTMNQSRFGRDGWANGMHARSGLGLGNDFANRFDRTLPPRRFTGKEMLPRFGGTTKRGR